MGLFEKELTTENLLKATKESKLAKLCGSRKLTVQQLLDAKDNVSMGVFHYAAAHGCLDQVKDVLAAGEKPTLQQMVEAKNDHDNTPLHYAAPFGERMETFLSLMPEETQLTVDILLKTKNKNNESLADGIVRRGNMPAILPLLPEKDRLPLARYALRKVDKKVLYDDEANILKGLEAIKGLSLKELSQLEKEAPEEWKTPEKQTRLNKLRQRVRKTTAPQIKPPAHRKEGR